MICVPKINLSIRHERGCDVINEYDTCFTEKLKIHIYLEEFLVTFSLGDFTVWTRDKIKNDMFLDYNITSCFLM